MYLTDFLRNLRGCFKGKWRTWTDWLVSRIGVHDGKFLKNQYEIFLKIIFMKKLIISK